MLTTAYRPLTAEERAILQAYTQPQREGCLDQGVSYFIALAGGLVVGMLLTTVLLVPLNYFHLLPKPAVMALLSIGCFAGFLVGLKSLWRRGIEEGNSRTVFYEDLAAGQVQVLHCTVAKAVAIDVDEDVGSSFFLEVSDTQVLFLYSPYLHVPEEGDDDFGTPSLFPNQSIDVVQSLVSRTVLSVVCLGDPLDESQTRVLEQWPEDAYFPEDGETITASLDTIEEDLMRLGKQKNRK